MMTMMRACCSPHALQVSSIQQERAGTEGLVAQLGCLLRALSRPREPLNMRVTNSTTAWPHVLQVCFTHSEWAGICCYRHSASADGITVMA
jgi:hypothetical protein